MANPKYWERENRFELNKFYISKINLIKKVIPKDVKTILDIGCGNGVITNELAKDYDVVGVDRSEKAIAKVKTKTLIASCDKIDIPDKSFNLVLTSEMLEHLEDELFYGAISEMKRLSKKYIFITVPNNENIKKNLVQCPYCKYIFNKTYHLRKLNIKIFQDLFREYKVVKCFKFGSKIRRYNSVLEKIKHKYSPSNSWIPNLWTPDGYRSTLCPKCSREFEYKYKFHPISFLCDILNILLSPKIESQLFLLLEMN